MSLGFNPNRPLRTTNLPGAVGGNILSISKPRVRNNLRRSSPITTTTVTVAPAATPRTTSNAASNAASNATSIGSIVKPDEQHKLYEEMQWVYADTTDEPLVDADTGKTVDIAGGTRVLMVYPMISAKDSGNVRMRMKSVNPVTGQLLMQWVIVYSPETDTRFLTRFSLC